MTNKNIEIPIRIVCNTNHNNNVLNSFKESLPYELKFNEPYSAGLSSISLPNSLLNIREDSVLNFGFFRKQSHYLPKTDNEILYLHKNIFYILVCSFSIKILKGAYTSHAQFCDSIYSQFLKTIYPDEKPDHSIFTYPLYYQLTYLEENKLNIINIKSQKLVNSFIDVTKSANSHLKTIQKNIKNQCLPEIYNFTYINDLINEQKHSFEKLTSKTSKFFWTNKDFWLYTKLKTFNFDMWPLNRSGDNFKHFKSRRYNAINNFTGEEVLKQALEFYVDVVWPDICKEKDKLKISTEKFLKKIANLEHIEILQSGLNNILDIYFEDLKLILFYINKKIEEQAPFRSVNSFLTHNKEIYKYFMPPLSTLSNVKKRNLMLVELKYFISRINYDEDRRKLYFDQLDESYLNLRSKLSTELTVLNTKGDVSVFLGHEHFRITKAASVCTYQPRIVSEPEIYIYCNQIDEQILNKDLVPLLHIVHAGDDTKYGGILQQTIPRPIFLKLNNRYIQNFDFEFRTRDGKLALFDNTSETITIMLILRPTSKGCI